MRTMFPNITCFDPDTTGERDETQHGFAVFNKVPHIGIEVPDGDSTISVRTSAGELITFCFLRAKSGDGPPTCVDIHHVSHDSVKHQDRWLHKQTIMVSGPGKGQHLDKVLNFPPTLTTLILEK